MKHFLLFSALFLSSASAFSQEHAAPINKNQGQPIEITAVETVEWLRDKQQYVARKDVIVTQGQMQILSDLLTADYREGQTSSTEIWQLTATGNVQVKDETNTAYGDLGIYDVTKGIATLTGENLRLVSPDQTVTATERMEYYANERMAKAIGNATVTRPQDTLKANVITAYFKDDSAKTPATAAETTSSAASPMDGSGNLDRLEADGNVIITTPTEKLYGSKAIYRADTNTAELIGKVKVERDQNVLEGERAEVDLTTNVSKMFGSKKEGGRVRGVFFPGSDSNAKIKGQDKKPETTPAAKVPVAAEAVAPPATNIPSVQTSTDQGGVTPPSAPAKVSPRVDY